MRYAGWYGYAIIKGLGAAAQTLSDIMFDATIKYKLFGKEKIERTVDARVINVIRAFI